MRAIPKLTSCPNHLSCSRVFFQGPELGKNHQVFYQHPGSSNPTPPTSADHAVRSHRCLRCRPLTVSLTPPFRFALSLALALPAGRYAVSSARRRLVHPPPPPDLEAKVGEKLLVANAMGVPIPQDPVVDESEDVDEAGALPRESTGEPGQHCDTSEGVQIVASKEVGVNGPRDRAFIGRRGCWWGWVSLRCAAPDGLTDSGRWWWLEVKRGRCQRAARPRFYRRVGGGRAGFGMTAARRASGVDREFEGGRVGERERCRSRGWAVVGRQKRGREREVERVGDAVEMDEWLALGDLNAVSLEYVGGRGRGAGAAGRDAGR
ncbi:hypothetical protein C8F04DRAFT_1177167 [Mycena alexandri]|uniref:Uncharacterized protein n=1 Tax=Mycena alexandri TaxID=1745969 RepID=A0AAD6X6Z1_9AGAR|nr:hypothetical protein C8F04DRAFT_1177167 [Mycena alexandri]